MEDLKNYTCDVIGLFGIQEAFKLCHLPFLTYTDAYGALALEGSSGTGKTTLVNRIGVLNKLAGGGDHGIYSADKARYEDFVGCPIPDDDTKSMEMYPMQHAVATKELVMIDEINRADYGNQEKWMSLISSRKIDGFNVATKYIFAGMNPVMSEDYEVYEGVQPLDKAVGERILGLVRMRSFSELSKEEQIHIMTAGFKQTEWTPTAETISLHKKFVDTARELYEQYKQQYTERVCEYIYKIERTFSKETKGSVRIESRRAQFLLINILANYALNTIYLGKNSLVSSALEGLELSFPGRLWEQPVAPQALKQAHNLAKDILSVDKEELKRSPNNFDGLKFPVHAVRKAVDEDRNKEYISKTIYDGLPNLEQDPINHYIYAYAVTKGLVDDNQVQDTMKAQEYDRFKRIADKIEMSDTYLKAKADWSYYRKYGQLPEGFDYPDFINLSSQDRIIEIYKSTMIMPSVGWPAIAIIELSGVRIRDSVEFMSVAEKISDTMAAFTNIAMKIKDCNVDWIRYD